MAVEYTGIDHRPNTPHDKAWHARRRRWLELSYQRHGHDTEATRREFELLEREFANWTA